MAWMHSAARPKYTLPMRAMERTLRGGFLEVQRVEACISDDVDVKITQSNHSVLVSVLRPIMVGRFHDALRALLEQQVCAALEGVDGLLWDVGKRADVFDDAGHGRGTPGILEGIVKKDGDMHFAIGAEPQVLSGEKRGPKGTLSNSVAQWYDLEGKKDAAAEGAERVKGVAEQASGALAHKPHGLNYFANESRLSRLVAADAMH
ncbi:hypothetical protein DAEQUDRAFT_815713 [Daedalea quercina L-15889]|uniref:HAM1-like C-terminal domain-containing protein n=1 Tax=Daedalea quercina L-15889 TaxID=1314783 RepID=A0A165KMW3_9APHY|nr:hypothetical protein DAEQUDRAFT_815713 [Daedalea quercina L-15889]